MKLNCFMSFTVYEICRDFSRGVNIIYMYSFFMLFYILVFYMEKN